MARAEDPDRLLAPLTEVAEAAGDGTALVLAATRAAQEHGGRPAWACAGITAGGDVAVLPTGRQWPPSAWTAGRKPGSALATR